jgi:hypothetical protein
MMGARAESLLNFLILFHARSSKEEPSLVWQAFVQRQRTMASGKPNGSFVFVILPSPLQISIASTVSKWWELEFVLPRNALDWSWKIAWDLDQVSSNAIK